jgi:hypothetical protein
MPNAKKPTPKPKPARSTPTAKVKSAATSAADLIERRISDLGDWRGETLAQVRSLILAADPGITEEWKWNVPVWSHHGIICTGESYAKAVKLTFAHGAALADPAGLFNASLTGSTRRAIDLHDGDRIDATAFTALIRAAIARNIAAKT